VVKNKRFIKGKSILEHIQGEDNTMGLFSRIKRAWKIWNEVVAERKACEKAEKESRELFQKVLSQRERIEKLKNHNKYADFEEIDENLTEIVENNEGLPEKEQFSVEQAKDFLYTFGKNKAAIVYAEHGVDPVNLAFIVHNVAKSQEKFLGQKLDGKGYLVDINRRLFDDAKSHLKEGIGKQGSVDAAYSTAQIAAEILEFADYSPEKMQEKIIEINKLLTAALLPNIQFLAVQGLVSEFNDLSNKFYQTLDKAGISPAQRAQFERFVKLYKGKCYNVNFNNSCKCFALNLLSIAELEKIAEEHNLVFKELDLVDEDIKANELKTRAAFNSNTYRIGINQLLTSIDPAARNGNPVLPEKEARDIAERVKKYAGLANLKPSEKKGTNHALRRVRRFYGWDNDHKPWEQKSGDKNGRNQMYKNPRYDRRARQLSRKHR